MINRILSWLTSFSVAAKSTPAEPKSKYDGFSVEYYPQNGVYYAKYKDGYLKRDYGTGIVQAKNDWLGFMYADRHGQERDAWHQIDLMLEQRTKENVKVFTRD